MYSFVLDSNFRTNFQPVQQADCLFRYSISTHKGGWKEGRLSRASRPSGCRDFGWSICNPLLAVELNGKRQGTLDSKMSFCQIDEPNVFLLTLKRAEDGDGIIVRLIETEGKDAAATLNLPHLTIKQAYRTNIVEENKEKATFTEHTITTPIKAFGITTFRIQT
jgi:alpha-mannosidase